MTGKKNFSWKSFFSLDFLGRRGIREAVQNVTSSSSSSQQQPRPTEASAATGVSSATTIVTVHSLNSSVQNVRLRAVTIYAFLTLVFVGALFYGIKLQLGFVDTMYFLLTTISTVGYGDIVPRTDSEMWFSVFYILITVGTVTGLFNIQREFVQMAQRLDEKKRMSRLGDAMRAVNIQFRESLRLEGSSASSFASIDKIEESVSRSISKTSDAIRRSVSAVRKSFTNAISDKEKAAAEEDGLRGSSMAEQQLATLQAMNLRNLAEELDDIFYVFLYDIFVIFLIIFIGGAIMSAIEGLPYVKGVYWACVTTSTIGFGDVVPKTTGGKVYNIFFLFFSVLYVTTTIASIAQYPVVQLRRRNEMAIMSQFGSNISEEMLDSLMNHEVYGLIGSNAKDDSAGASASASVGGNSAAAEAARKKLLAADDESISSNSSINSNSGKEPPSSFSSSSWSHTDRTAPPTLEKAKPTSKDEAVISTSTSTSSGDNNHRDSDEGDESGDGSSSSVKLSRAEFILVLLNMMEKVQAKDIILVASVFDTLDRDKDGFLSRNDVEIDRAIIRNRKSLMLSPDDLLRLSESDDFVIGGDSEGDGTGSSGGGGSAGSASGGGAAAVRSRRRSSLGNMIGAIRATLSGGEEGVAEGATATAASTLNRRLIPNTATTSSSSSSSNNISSSSASSNVDSRGSLSEGNYELGATGTLASV